MRAMIPVAARIAATTSTATPSGFPQDAPNSKVVATAITVMLMVPSRRLVSSFAPRIDAGEVTAREVGLGMRGLGGVGGRRDPVAARAPR